jgi:hypothetical protein
MVGRINMMTILRGIKQTHQPSPWINDYASFSLNGGYGGSKISTKMKELHGFHIKQKKLNHIIIKLI